MPETQEIKIETKLPKGWKFNRLEEVCQKITKTNSKLENPTDEFIYIDINSIDNTINQITDPKKYKWNDAPSRAQQKIFNGDIVFSTVRTYMKNIALVPEKHNYAIASTGFCVLRPGNKLISKFLFYFTLNDLFLKPLNELQRGTSYPAVRNSDVLNQFIPLPEQHRIVEKIEELFSELDHAIATLKTARQQLHTYRLSVLKHAFDGRLNYSSIELNGQKSRNESNLPTGWEFVTLKEVCIKIGDIDHKMPKQVDIGYPYVSTKDFTDDLKISFDNVKYITKEDYINLSRKIKPERGDIIFPRYGTIGKNIFIDFDMEFLVSYSCAVLKPNQSLVNPKFIYWYTLSPQISEEIRKYVVETTQANVGISSIKNFVFPFPPIAEQKIIVYEIETRLSESDYLLQTIDQQLTHAERLRQSILQRAFSGEL